VGRAWPSTPAHQRYIVMYIAGSEEKPLQEVLPEVSPEGAAGPATASDVDVSGGLGPPPETPPRTVSDLAAGVPITPAPSLESQGDRSVACR
jgi:hypothetical protein